MGTEMLKPKATLFHRVLGQWGRTNPHNAAGLVELAEVLSKPAEVYPWFLGAHIRSQKVGTSLSSTR